jgi:hypothetical protein
VHGVAADGGGCSGAVVYLEAPMTTKFEADVAAAYKAVDERVEIICSTATRLLLALDDRLQMANGHPYIRVDLDVVRLMQELRRVMK